jgi:hypothetical protein
MAVLTISSSLERDQKMKRYVNTVFRGVGTITKVSHHPSGHTFFVVEKIVGTTCGQTLQIDHLSLGRFNWHRFDGSFIDVGVRVEFEGIIRPYARSSRTFNAIGLPRIDWAKPAE